MPAIDPGVLVLIDELEKLRATRDDHWQVPRIEGDVLFQLAFVTNAKLVVEVGTSYGFSGLFWGAALKRTGGKLHTIDINPQKFESSKATFKRAGLDNIITNHLGDAKAVLPTISGAIDLAFLDSGDKKSTGALFDLLWPRVRPGGSIVTDNATTHRAELSDYISHVRSLPDALSSEIPVGNGVEWTVKTPRD